MDSQSIRAIRFGKPLTSVGDGGRQGRPTGLPVRDRQLVALLHRYAAGYAFQGSVLGKRDGRQGGVREEVLRRKSEMR
jgi:hypothetical protein